MRLPMKEICDFGDCNVNSRNYREGEKLLNIDHILKCGKIGGTESGTKIQAYVIQSSHIKEKPHSLEGEINFDGSIKSFMCNCKAGESQKCKHILAVLLYLNRVDVDDLENLSCTDVKCLWKDPHKKVLEKYEATAVGDHPCYKDKYEELIKVSTDTEDKLKKLFEQFPDNALSKHQ